MAGRRRHAGHFTVAAGYDNEHIYLNDPSEPEDELAVNIPVPLTHFLEAWANGAHPEIVGARVGPYWMIYIRGEREKEDAQRDKGVEQANFC